MSAITKLEEHLARAKDVLQEQEAIVNASPENFMARVSLQSFRAHIEDLQLQLYRAKRERAVEIVEVRLQGRLTRSGSIPLYLLAALAADFADAIHAASQKLKSGRHVQRISQTTVERLNLRLADLAPGSTRLFITGDLQPDLFGYSLLENSLEEAFGLFNAENDEALASAVAAIGIRSTRGIRDFLSTAKRAELDVEISWTPADERPRTWAGNYQRIAHLTRTLGQFQMREPTQMTIRGEVIMLSARGRFEILSDRGLIHGAFPSDLLPEVSEVRIGDEVVAGLERTLVVNTVTHTEKADYTLLSIATTGQSRLSTNS